MEDFEEDESDIEDAADWGAPSSGFGSDDAEDVDGG